MTTAGRRSDGPVPPADDNDRTRADAGPSETDGSVNAAAHILQFPRPSRPEVASPPDGVTDHDLIRGVQRGDANAFRSLFERHQRRAYGIAYQMVGNAE